MSPPGLWTHGWRFDLTAGARGCAGTQRQRHAIPIGFTLPEGPSRCGSSDGFGAAGSGFRPRSPAASRALCTRGGVLHCSRSDSSGSVPHRIDVPSSGRAPGGRRSWVARGDHDVTLGAPAVQWVLACQFFCLYSGQVSVVKTFSRGLGWPAPVPGPTSPEPLRRTLTGGCGVVTTPPRRACTRCGPPSRVCPGTLTLRASFAALPAAKRRSSISRPPRIARQRGGSPSTTSPPAKTTTPMASRRRPLASAPRGSARRRASGSSSRVQTAEPATFGIGALGDAPDDDVPVGHDAAQPALPRRQHRPDAGEAHHARGFARGPITLQAHRLPRHELADLLNHQGPPSWARSSVSSPDP
jgi:hypothetical protein